MIGLDTIFLLLTAAYIAWGIGANDETMMIVASGSSLSINRLILIGAIATSAGAIIYGEMCEETIGKGGLTFPATSKIGLIIITGTASWLTVVSWLGWPISTSHSTVGAVIGYGLFAGGNSINWQNLNKIFLSWLVSPLVGFFLSYMIVKPLVKMENNNSGTRHNGSKSWLYSLLFGALLQEFWQGANNVSNATAFLSVTVVV